MKSYIFKCDDFVPDERGGTFVRGRRKFSLVTSSSRLSDKILQHVRDNRSFTESDFPGVVIAALLREGLLEQEGPSSIKRRMRGFVHRTAAKWRDGPLVSIATCQIYSIFARPYRSEPLILFSSRTTTALMRPLAWAFHPLVVLLLAVFDAVCLVETHQFRELRAFGAAIHLVPEPLLVIGFLLASLLVHEFGHAAVACNRLHKCGSIRLHRLFGIIPFLAAQVPDIGRLPTSSRIAISVAGPVLQIAIALGLGFAFPHSITAAYASQLTVVIASLSLIPITGADGYWALSDLLGAKRPQFTLRILQARAVDIFYTAVILSVTAWAAYAAILAGGI